MDRAGLFALRCMAMEQPFSKLRTQLDQSVSDMRQSCRKLNGRATQGPRSTRLIQVIDSMEPKGVKRG